jgi:hypothetical protein
MMPGGEAFFPEDFKGLVTAMLSYDPTQRPTIEDIRASAWYSNPNVATLEEV